MPPSSHPPSEGRFSVRQLRLIATPIILLVLLAILLWAGSWGWRQFSAPLPTPEPIPCATQPVTTVTPEDVSIKVFNGGFTRGLAGRVARTLQNAGFTILRVDNTEERVETTTVRGNIHNQAALDLAASYFPSVTIEHDERVDGTIDVLVGSGFEDFSKTPLQEITSDTGTLCVPVTSSPDPSSEEQGR